MSKATLTLSQLQERTAMSFCGTWIVLALVILVLIVSLLILWERLHKLENKIG